MLANLWLVSFLSIFLAGCTVVSEFLGNSGSLDTWDSEVSPQTVETPAPFTPPGPLVEKQTQAEICDCSPPTEPTENEPSEVSGPVKKNPSKEQIQRAQALLKVSGMDPGPVDGIMGPKTRAALEAFHSRCTTVSHLIGTLDMEILQQAAAKTQAAPFFSSEIQTNTVVSDPSPPTEPINNPSKKVNALVGQNLTREQVRLVQIRLKASGFDPGPIDGVMGPKTRAALQQELKVGSEY